jgi:fructosamine-3-kinase
MSSGLSSHLFQILSRVTGRSDLELPALYPVEGGSINATYRITTKNSGLWFCKINDSGALPDLFEKERRGLDLLGKQGIFRIPAVVACEKTAGKQVLLPPRSLPIPHQPAGGLLLPPRSPEFPIPLERPPSSDWTMTTTWAPSPNKIPNYPGGLTFLLGVGWSHRSGWLPKKVCWKQAPFAMTTLFGGFEKSFYESYAWHFPFPANYREQWEVCHLYPLLIHLNLFGESYRRNILHTIQRF